jgi:hypothetical protein
MKGTIMIATEKVTGRGEFIVTDVDEKQKTLARARGALKAMQEIAARSGNSNISLEEINAEITEVRNCCYPQ